MDVPDSLPAEFKTWAFFARELIYRDVYRFPSMKGFAWTDGLEIAGSFGKMSVQQHRELDLFIRTHIDPFNGQVIRDNNNKRGRR